MSIIFPACLSFLAGMPPCYLDAAEKPEGQLFPLPCRMLSYEGVPPRALACWQNQSIQVAE